VDRVAVAANKANVLLKKVKSQKTIVEPVPVLRRTIRAHKSGFATTTMDRRAEAQRLGPFSVDHQQRRG
jgi:hypothetical protein